MNNPKITSVIIAIIGILGFIDASYLTYMRQIKMPLPCSVSIFSGCQTVTNSPYSVVFGIPLSAYGMLFYIGAIAIASAYFFYQNDFLRKSLVYVTLLGLISSVYFVYIQAFVIGAFCAYCIFSAFTSTMMAILAVYHLRKFKTN